MEMKRIGIIGAGVVGLFTGYFLVRSGFRVRIYERCESLGCGISGHNAGVLHLIQSPFNSIKSYLSRLGCEEYRRFKDVFGYGILDTELLIAALNKLDMYYLRLVKYVLKRQGFKSEMVDKKWLKNYSGLSDEVVGAIRIPGYGVVEPVEVLNKLLEYLVNNGVEIDFNIDGSEVDGDDFIIVTAGSESYRIGLVFGDDPPRHRFALGVMVNLRYKVDAIYAYPPNPFKRYTKGGAVIPKDGYTLIGPGFKWVDGHDASPSSEDVSEVYHRFKRLLGAEPEVISYDYGVRPINIPSDDFIVRKRGNAIFTYGIDSPGFTAAPLLGRIISNLVRYDSKFYELRRENIDKLLVGT